MRVACLITSFTPNFHFRSRCESLDVPFMMGACEGDIIGWYSDTCTMRRLKCTRIRKKRKSLLIIFQDAPWACDVALCEYVWMQAVETRSGTNSSLTSNKYFRPGHNCVAICRGLYFTSEKSRIGCFPQDNSWFKLELTLQGFTWHKYKWKQQIWGSRGLPQTQISLLTKINWNGKLVWKWLTLVYDNG